MNKTRVFEYSIYSPINRLAWSLYLEHDWKYDLNNCTWTWTKNEGDKQYKLEVGENGRSQAKKIFANGRSHNMKNYYCNENTDTNIKNFLKEYKYEKIVIPI